MDSSTRQRLDRSKNLVGFLLGDVSYAVEIASVREIINPLPVVELPHAPPAVIGVCDHRGEVVPIVDLRARFGLASADTTRRTKWIIVRFDERSVGLVVDSVTDVFGAGPQDAGPTSMSISPTPSTVPCRRSPGWIAPTPAGVPE